MRLIVEKRGVVLPFCFERAEERVVFLVAESVELGEASGVLPQ